MLLNAGANPNAPVTFKFPNGDEHGLTALHISAEGGKIELVRMLLAAGANLNAKSSKQRDALSIAEKKGHDEIVALLCASGATCTPPVSLAPQCLRELSFDGTDMRFGNTCHDLSIRIGYHCQRYSDSRDFAGETDVLPPGGEVVVPHPCADRSEISGVAPHLPTLYHMACGTVNGTPPAPRLDKVSGTASCGESADKTEQLKKAESRQPASALDEVAQASVQAGGGCVWTERTPDLRPIVGAISDGNRIRMCPLHDAAATGDMRQVSAMLSAGANANVTASDGETPLHHAAREGHVEVAKSLLGAGANADARDADGCTPLHWAAKMGRAGTAGALLGGGASVNARCGGINETALIVATQEGHVDVMRTLLGANADADAKDYSGSAALHYAASKRLDEDQAIKAVQALLRAGADANVRAGEGWTPLHVAVRESSVNVARALLEAGAPVNAKDQAGLTPYDWAERRGSRTMQDLLLAAGGSTGRNAR